MIRSRLMVMLALTLLTASLGVLTSPASPAFADPATWHVRPGATGDCTAARPCGTLKAALRLAGAGDEVLLATGTYAGETIDVPKGWAGRTAPATVRPAPGAAPVLTGMWQVVQGQLTLRDLRLQGAKLRFAGQAGILLENLTAVASTVSANGADRFVLRNSSFSNNTLTDFVYLGGGSDDVVVENNIFSTSKGSKGPIHPDCIQIGGPNQRITIRNNTMRLCAHSAMMVGSPQGPVDDVVIERNVIEGCPQVTSTCWAPYAVQVAADLFGGTGIGKLTGVVLRHNTISGGVYLKAGIGPAVVEGNVLSAYETRGDGLWVGNCRTLHVIEWNMVDRMRGCTTLPSSNLKAGPDFVNRATFDLRLRPASHGVDRGSPVAVWPSFDGAGEACGPADLGAFEQCGSPPALPRFSGAAPDVLASWDFSSGSGASVPGTGALPATRLTVEPGSGVSFGHTGMAIWSRSRLRLDGGGGPLADALAASRAVTLDAWITPERAIQPLGGTLVSFSLDGYRRNLALRQGKPSASCSCFTAFVRDGAKKVIQFSTPPGTATTRFTHVALSVDRNGVARIFVDGVQRASAVIPGGIGTSWDRTYPVVVGADVGGTPFASPWLGTLHAVAISSSAE